MMARELTPIVVIVNAGAGQGHGGDLAASLREKFAAVGLDGGGTPAAGGGGMSGGAREGGVARRSRTASGSSWPAAATAR
jgi:hypothetical protein